MKKEENEINCFKCIHKNVCKLFLNKNWKEKIDYSGDIGKKYKCKNFKYINWEYFTMETFKKYIIDSINEFTNKNDMTILWSIYYSVKAYREKCHEETK